MLAVDHNFPMSYHAVFTLCVSDTHNFTADPSSVCDYGYRTYGELARFTYCLLRKVKAAQSLPLVEKWEDFMFSNHWWFPHIEEKEFLVGSRIASAVEKVGNVYLRNEFRKDAQNFLEELSNTVLPTVATRSDVGQGLSCSCPENVVWGLTLPLFVCSASFWMA